MQMAMKTCLGKAKRAAINHDWTSADEELRALLLRATIGEQQTISSALLLLAADSEKLNLSQLALWAYEWVAQIMPTHATPYLRLAAYYERGGQRQTALEWLKRGVEMAAGNQQLHRTYRRVCGGR